jgi:outer membrane receptor protein involved in Fe transport
LIENFGVDMGISYFPTKNLELQANYSYFDFNLLDAKTTNPFLISGFDIISANTSPNRVNLSATYSEPRLFDITIQYRFVDSFTWLAGDFRGEVPSYGIVNLNGGYQFSDNLKAGFNVYNLLDVKHFQILGGTLVPRLANVSLSYTI